jgi:enoyl-CoA hydratase/carnithine racemase
MTELSDALDEVDQGSSHVLVLRGAGDRAFVSGGDLRDLAGLRTVTQASAMASHMRRLLDRLASLPIPTIAGLNGHALGGGAEVALACDLRFAAADVGMAFNQSQLAIMPAWGGVERLVQLVGRSTALHLLLTGSKVDASQALRMGLIDRMASAGNFENELHAFTNKIGDLPFPVSRAIKGVVQAAESNSHPALAQYSVGSFASLWIAEEHWAAAAGKLGQQTP